MLSACGFADSANPCNTLIITRNEIRSAVPVRSSALLFPYTLLANWLLVEADRAVRVGDGQCPARMRIVAGSFGAAGVGPWCWLMRMPTAEARRDGLRTPAAASAVRDR
jgi:hypothetical protein